MTPQEQDAKLRYRAMGEAVPGLREAVIGFVRAQLGWPDVGPRQDESVVVMAVVPHEGGWLARFVYVFDHDCDAQFDMSDRFRGEIALDAAGGLRSGTLDRVGG